MRGARSKTFIPEARASFRRSLAPLGLETDLTRKAIKP
jgi:hypothetical protein